MSWQPLSALAHDVWRRARATRYEGNFVEQAARLAMDFWSEEVAVSVPSVINVAGLVLAGKDRLEVHQARQSVVRVVEGTDLHREPEQAPALLARPFVLEAVHADRGEFLFGDTASLGVYPHEDTYTIVGIGRPDWARTVKWSPKWRGQEIDAGLANEHSPLVATDAADAYFAWSLEAVRFVLVYAILLEADRTPLVVASEAPAIKRGASARQRADAEAWRVSRVRVTDAVARVIEAPVVPSFGDPAGVASLVRVCGHLKRQPHGPERSLRKWVWVEGYEARRWLAPGAIKKVVS